LFHAGDCFYFPSGNSNTKYHVVAPADGIIVHAYFINDSIGWEINVRTPFVVDEKTVYYDVVHTSGLVPGLKEGMYIHKGDKLAIKSKEYLDPANYWLVDIGFRNGHKQTNASLEGWTGLGYFSFTRLLLDDFEGLDPKQYDLLPLCKGNPIKQNKPYATPTPGGFTYP
jgi:hypothetical protein